MRGLMNVKCKLCLQISCRIIYLPFLIEGRYKVLMGHVYCIGARGAELITMTSQDVSDGPIALTWGNNAYDFCQSDSVAWQHSSVGAVL
jgi:hypothetical protein